MKATQSDMGEGIQMIQEALGQVSCCLWEGIGPSPLRTLPCVHACHSV